MTTYWKRKKLCSDFSLNYSPVHCHSHILPEVPKSHYHTPTDFDIMVSVLKSSEDTDPQMLKQNIYSHACCSC